MGMNKMVGFDIGEKTMKMAYVVGGKVKKTAVVEVPESMVADGQIIAADAMSAFISESAKTYGIPKGDAALILPPSQVFVRTATLPVMTEHQLVYNLPYEFKDYLTEDKNKYVYDYEVLENISDEEGHPKEMKLFICATPRDVIERDRTILARAGFKLKVAVPEEYVFAKLFRQQVNAELKEGAAALIDFGQAETRMHILLNGEYDNKRTFDMGVDALEKLIADVTYSDVHMAHSYLSSNHDDIIHHERCMDFYNQIGVEIMKATNFYNYNNQEVELKNLYVFGGGSAIDPMIDTIRSVTRLNVYSADKLLGGDLAAEEPWLMLRAVGAAAED